MAAPPTPYELLRAQKIAKNAEMLAELGVIDASNDVKSELRGPNRPKRPWCSILSFSLWLKPEVLYFPKLLFQEKKAASVSHQEITEDTRTLP